MEAKWKNRFGRPGGGWRGSEVLKSEKNDGNRRKTNETEEIGGRSVRWSARSSPPGLTCSSEAVEGRPVGARTPFRTVAADEGEGAGTRWKNRFGDRVEAGGVSLG